MAVSLVWRKQSSISSCDQDGGSSQALVRVVKLEEAVRQRWMAVSLTRSLDRKCAVEKL